MREIRKYKLNHADCTYLDLPKDAEILDFQYQGDDIVLWALVLSEEKETTKRKFSLIGTGHSIGHPRSVINYLKTLQQDNGLVWHIFEINYK